MPRMQLVHGSIVLLLLAGSAGCGDDDPGPPLGAAANCFTEVLAECLPLEPGQTLPREVTRCYRIEKGGTYVQGKINVLDGGKLLFMEAPGETIDFQVESMLIEQGGVVQAGNEKCTFGQHGGKLVFSLYGDDPTEQGRVADAEPGIDCLTNAGADQPCFPPDRQPHAASFYCTGDDPTDPCASTTAPAENPKNALLEHYGNLNFDPTPWGYKTIGVAYGGQLLLYGRKGAKPIQDPEWAARYEGDGSCKVPTVEESTLDADEMRAWARLSGTSWARLDGSEDAPADDRHPGHTTLTLDRALPDWEVGDEIVVGTTDWYPGHNEVRTIRGIAALDDRTVVTVDPLEWPHHGDIFDTDTLERDHAASFTSPVERSAVDTRAVVGLLSRSIRIQSLGAEPRRSPDEPGFPEVADCLDDGSGDVDPGCYFGGHVVVRQGFGRFHLQGVELKSMGQGGRMGHYPVHFHHVKSTAYAPDTAVKDSSIWDSMNRFVVLHGTHDVTIARNVGYLSLGHGYYLEDGSEIDNALCHNVGIGARAATRELFQAQADPRSFVRREPGDPPRPRLEARFVPPILDGVALNETFTAEPHLYTGSDALMPVMYWFMNAHNELVGNQAVGVSGFGSCYWLLGSAVSGASRTHAFDGYAAHNEPGRQAPLLRFRGNGCVSSAYALPASAEMPPASKEPIAFTHVKNPYVFDASGAPRPGVEASFSRPIVSGNFQPAPMGTERRVCAQATDSAAALEENVDVCVMSVIDRFSTSFNWAQVNFGSIWLRPFFYLFSNGAVTDQLYGGLTFVTAGSWLQVPPGYFSLAKNNLFVGVTQHGGSRWAERSGPILWSKRDDPWDLVCEGGDTCNIPAQGTGYFHGSLNPKRLINIYDGPSSGDGNTFVNVGSWTCDPQPCRGPVGECDRELPCGMYTTTQQPMALDGRSMEVIDAAIGWKQPNGFYYPPAFAHRASAFLADLPEGLPEPEAEDPLNTCFSRGPEDRFQTPASRPGSCRHNVFDRTRAYIKGETANPFGAPTVWAPDANPLTSTPIDFSTILVDLDGTLTGARGRLSGVDRPMPTSSVSRNTFFDAPAQSPECLSYGVQTSPYGFVTTLLAPIAGPARDGDTHVDVVEWSGPPPVAGETRPWPLSPMVAIYRQWKLASDAPSCGAICDGTTYGCDRGTFMVGPNVSQAISLTMTIPPGVDRSDALYFIDTSSGANQPIDCVSGRTLGVMQPATFHPEKSYVLYNLFARPDAISRYALHVGTDDLASLGLRYVRVDPHRHRAGGTTYESVVEEPCDPSAEGSWCSGMPAPRLEDGVLTVTLDHRSIAGDFEPAARADHERCMPRDTCFFDGTTCRPCALDPAKCDDPAQRRTTWQSVHPEDAAALNRIDATELDRPEGERRGALEVVCEDWAGVASGTTTVGDVELSLADCPAGGCLGIAFTLPAGFVGDRSYADVGARLATCVDEAEWAGEALVALTDGEGDLVDALCGAPRASEAADFCAE